MADIVDRETRSRMMAGIKGKNTKPELLVRKYLHRTGLRFRLHGSSLPGRPDIVLPKYRTVVFVHGCFWHQHPGCPYAYSPKSNREFWQLKLQGNVERDKKHVATLMAEGWKVLTTWECQASNPDVLHRIVEEIKGLD